MDGSSAAAADEGRGTVGFSVSETKKPGEVGAATISDA
jgi:hypothetical protein